MRNGHDAIDIRIFLATVKGVLGNERDLLRLMAGAHAGRNYQHKVACSGATVRTAEPLEGGPLVQGDVLRRSGEQLWIKIAHDRHFVSHALVSDLLTFLNTERGAYRLTV